ncbi:MAG: tetratricopeptide repeat protein, partial [Myxococcota bacterium]
AIGIWARVLDPTDLRSGSAMTKLGSIYRYQGEYEASVAALQRAIGVLAEAGGDRGYELGFAYLELGETYGATERWKEAAAALERCLAIYESVFGSDHPRTAQVLNNLGSMISDGGAPARAEPYLRRAVNIFRPLEGNTYWKGLTQWSLANSLRDQGKRGEAATWYRSAIILFERETREGGGFRALSELKADFAALSARDEPPSE